MTGQVTALGIRDGDPAVLQALVDRRGFAVLAFCERACPPGAAVEAAADAFARFRAMVRLADRPAELDPEAALLSAARHAAASRMPRPPGQAPAVFGRLLGGRAHGQPGPDVAGLLARRADGLLDPAGEQRLTQALGASAEARAIDQRLRAAEHAYLTARPRDVPSGVIEHIVSMMAGRPLFAGAPPHDHANGDDPGQAAGPPLATEPFVAAEPPAEAEPEAPAVARAAGSGFFAGAFAMRGAEPEPAAVEASPEQAPEGVSEARASDDEPRSGADEPQPGVDPDVPAVDAADPDPAGPLDDTASSSAMTPAEADPQLTEEWSLPADEVAGEHALDTGIAAARLERSEHAEDDEAAHLQSASGAVDEPLLAPDPADEQPDARRAEPAGAVTATPGTRGVPRSSTERQPVPGKGALIPAGAVVAIAAIGALAASGIFGGEEPSPPLDTGIVPPRALQAVPEGEAAEIVDALRSSAGDARRQRMADRRQALTNAQVRPDPPARTPRGDDEDDATQSPASAPDTGAGQGGSAGAGSGAQDDAPATGGATPDTGGTADEPTITGEVGGDAAP